MKKVARALLLFLVAASASAQTEQRIAVEFPPAPNYVDSIENFSVTAGGVVVSFHDGFRSWIGFSTDPLLGAYGTSDRMFHWGMDISFSEPVKDIRFFFLFDEFSSDFSVNASNNRWSENTFRFPVEWVNFGRNASGVNAEGINALRIEIDQAVNTPAKWCTSVDWAALEFDAIAPIFLVHGTNADSSTWPSPLTDYLDSIGIPYSKEIDLRPNGAIVENGELLASRLRELGKAFGARACHIVAHSKGGNDSRHFLVHHYDPSVMKVLSLSTLSTPFRGTVIADILELARANPGRESTNPFIKDVMSSDYFLLRLLLPRGPALRDNTTRVMLDYNLANPFPSGIKFYNLAADADYDQDRSISDLEITSLFPRFLRAAAEGSYHALATIKTVHVRKTERTVITRNGPRTVQLSLIEIDERATGFEENDLVVTVRSAKHPSGIFLAQFDDNHGSMKSPTAMKVILSRIASDHPRRTP